MIMVAQRSVQSKNSRSACSLSPSPFVAGQVASYKQLRAVEFIDEIPKSASGKILRRFLRSGA